MRAGRVVNFFILLAIIWFLWSWVANVSQQANSTLNDLSYSALLKEIDAGNIGSIELSNTGKITGTFKSPVGDKTQFVVEYLPISAESADALSSRIMAKNPSADIRTKIESDGFMMILLLQYLPIIFLIGLFFYVARKMQNGPNKVMAFGKSKARLVQDRDKRTFSDVAGVDEAKEELREIVEFLKNPGKFASLGAKIPSGVLLIGPPGTGKTLLAKAVAGEAQVPFFSISGSEFVEMFVGVGASRVRDLFEQGRKSAPCIIFIDEIDAVGRQRGTGLGGGHDEREQTLNQLLAEMDGFEGSLGVIIIAATNRPDVLDSSLLRPGRFDRRVVVGKPDVRGRLEILRVHAKRLPLDERVDLEIVARGTHGFTGADLANLLNEAALNAAGNNQRIITLGNIEYAKDKVLMGTEKKSMIISDKDKRITAYHEAGHALVALMVPEADPIHKVTIVPRGMSLGATWQLPTEDKHNYSKTYLLSQLRILMGGRCAEEITFGEETTGASNDIDRASEIARRMVCEWGMSELGPIKFGEDSLHPFLGKQLSEGRKNYSEDTARKIDDEIKRILTEAHDEAKITLKLLQDKLQKIAELLLDKETIGGEEVLGIVKGS